ncbi:MAG: response regulator [Methanomicrobiales archaeon]|nr:response regulator [Methanomicrobiales archaeon]
MSQARIFIVEDDDIIAKTTEWRIKKLGHECCGRAMNGTEALEKIAEAQPEIVLMDISLSSAPDGITVAEEIRKNNSGIAIVYLTSRTDEETLARAKKTHPNAYLVKPFDDKDLRVALELASAK